MLFARLVVQKRFFGSALFDGLAGDEGALPLHLPVEHRHFQGGEGGTRVAVGKVGDRGDELVFDVYPAAEASLVRQGAAQEGGDLFRLQRLQHEHLAARQERPVDLEGRVFGGGADEDDAAPLYKGQKGVLLGLVEAVDLVYKQDGLGAEQAAALGALHDGADLFDARGDGGKVDKFRLGAPGNDAGEGGLAHARRAPEDHRADLVALDQPPQHLAFAQKVRLTRKFVQRARAHARGERLAVFAFKHRTLLHGKPPTTYSHVPRRADACGTP